MAESVQFALDALPTLLIGAITTLQLTAAAVFLGLIGGTLLGIARLSSFKPLQIASRIYIDFFRGTPLLVQIFMIYFGIPAVTGFSFNRFLAAIMALSLNAAAYLAEIVRGGIQSIETGQREASESLGLSPLQTMRYIIFPQAFRRMIPPLGNEFITLLKDTSLVAVIGYEEILRRGQLIVATNYRAFEIYFMVALVYLVLNILSAQAFIWLEKQMDPARKSKRQETAIGGEAIQ
ncbi:MAG: amino acid ABC transporter permease [Leptolyngbya sp. SIOISBB]|nr:amino acid ABC transporter permease [Leptolyngbya sp. SIOISBB]